MSYMKNTLTMQMGIRNVNMHSYCIMHKLTPSSVHILVCRILVCNFFSFAKTCGGVICV